MKKHTLCTTLLLILGVVACKTVVPTKPKVALPPPPLPQSVPTKARAMRVGQPQPKVVTNGLPPLITTNAFGFTGIFTSTNAVFLTWTGTTNPVAIQASADLKHWTNASAPVPQNSLSLTNYADKLFYRLRQATNQIQVSKAWMDSAYLSTNGAGQTGIITHDFDSVYLTLYGRDKRLVRYWIDEMIPMDLNYGCGYAWTGNGHLVVSYVPSYTNRGFVDEFAIAGTNINRLSEIVTGDADSRTPDVLRMSDGTIVVCADQHCGGFVCWMLHRKPTGQWIDDGAQAFIPCGGEAASFPQLAESPWDHRLIISQIRDSSHVLSVVQAEYFGINSTLTVLTNFVLASSDDSPDIAPHGEIPPLKAVGDPFNNRVIFIYGNEQRDYILGTPNGDFSCTHVACVSMDSHFSKSLLFVCPGLVERVAELQSVNLSNGLPIVTYIPVTAASYTNWPPVSTATRVINGQEVSQEIYLNGYWNLFQHRNYRDIVGIRDDGWITAILNP